MTQAPVWGGFSTHQAWSPISSWEKVWQWLRTEVGSEPFWDQIPAVKCQISFSKWPGVYVDCLLPMATAHTSHTRVFWGCGRKSRTFKASHKGTHSYRPPQGKPAFILLGFHFFYLTHNIMLNKDIDNFMQNLSKQKCTESKSCGP